ncbi:SIS domain-containing protein [Candidatus Bathyarchaeota archaeon]|nr:SIS domain-containing protein [Candidatus Bathyarchaeota archaeon]
MKTDFQCEIEEQGEALRNLISFYGQEGNRLLKKWKKMLSKMYGNLLFSGMGTSFFSPLIIKPLLASRGIMASIYEAGELLHYELKAVHKKDLIVLISQSGESIETCKVAEKLKNTCPIVVIVNNEDSTLAGYGDLVLPMVAGEEKSITTKTYTNTLGLLNMMGVTAVCDNLEKELNNLKEASFQMDSFLESRAEEVDFAVKKLENVNVINFLSRGPSMAGAFQGALTFMEGARITALAMPCGSFRHGSFELVREGHHAIVYVPSSQTGRLVIKMISEMTNKGSRIVAFSANTIRIKRNEAFEITFPKTNDRHLPIAAATPQELMLDKIASLRGLTCGIFQYGSKITKVE